MSGVQDEIRREAQVRYMRALPMVKWDRLAENGDYVLVYGWIDREDTRSDFVLLTFYGAELQSYTTSSAAHSEDIGERLYGETAEHAPCRRVADVYGGRLA